MIIQCESCSKKFIVKDSDIPKEGRNVQCGYCSFTWHQKLTSAPDKPIKLIKEAKSSKKQNETLSVDSIKASDGKTYKFLGSQWAELLPSGKTGLFAKKKIGKELDKITGRKIEKTSEKKRKKELDPSSQGISGAEKLPDIYKPREGLGFFGYIFLLIIIGFSIVGILKTFETDLLNRFPEIEYVFEILDQQLIFISETVKNMITIFNDLIDTY
ncbi:zinc-ribbon domain-containing protein [Pelagibacteraceae bacterium]|nr:zinc-ribbon domain-containing protein [Pelagibacteraceae bacterium]